MKTINNTKYTVLAMASCALLTACGGSDQSSQPSKPTLLSAVQSGSNSGGTSHGNTPLTCGQLVGITIPASIIGVGLVSSGNSTTGAVVTSAVVTDGATLPDPAGQFCKVKGDIHPLDPNAPAIEFQVNLPVNWNQKAMMFGGGGYEGNLEVFSGLGNVVVAASTHASPLARGYATIANDSGHKEKPPFIIARDGSFAVNDEALINFGGQSLKKTRDVAMYLIQLHYGSAPSKTYIQGGSSGGREALVYVQRWPQDIDGAISMFPAWNSGVMSLQFGRVSRAFAQPGAYLDDAKRKLVYQASIAQCDGYDGVNDGVVSNISKCNAQFNPATAILPSTGSPLRCPGGVALDAPCISDAQINALQVYASEMQLSAPLASGENRYPGYNIWGTDLGMVSSDPGLFLAPTLGLNIAQPADQVTPEMPFITAFYDQWVKYFVTRDANYASLSLDPQNLGIWQARVNQLSLIQDNNKTDLSAFANKGGKILFAHGIADALLPTKATADYFLRLQSTMGKSKVKSFARYWEIPGYGHSLSPNFNATFDTLTMLEKWVEQGIKPKNQVTVDKTGVPGRSRPLCDFPKWPKYKHGDVNLASSFKCTSGNEGDDEEDEGDDD